MDASKEVRNLLEFLYLDVKVRSPAEVSIKPLLTTNAFTDPRVDRCEARPRAQRADTCTNGTANQEYP